MFDPLANLFSFSGMKTYKIITWAITDTAQTKWKNNEKIDQDWKKAQRKAATSQNNNGTHQVTKLSTYETMISIILVDSVIFSAKRYTLTDTHTHRERERKDIWYIE